MNNLDRCALRGMDAVKVLNWHDSDGKTALHWAVINKQFDLADVLLALGADINQVDSSGKTPLDYATGSSLRERSWTLRGYIQSQRGKRALNERCVPSLPCAYHGPRQVQHPPNIRQYKRP